MRALESLGVAVVMMCIEVATGQGTADSRPVTETKYPIGYLVFYCKTIEINIHSTP